MTERTLVVLEDDQTGQELLEEALHVLDPNVIRVPLNLVRFDLPLEERRATDNQIVRDSAAPAPAISRTK
jgi:isocitrate dehydrogenase (NAD+)